MSVLIAGGKKWIDVYKIWYIDNVKLIPQEYLFTFFKFSFITKIHEKMHFFVNSNDIKMFVKYSLENVISNILVNKACL